ncbi:MAG: glycosyltransferase family 4 protein [Chloroflexota bacterium]
MHETLLHNTHPDEIEAFVIANKMPEQGVIDRDKKTYIRFPYNFFPYPESRAKNQLSRIFSLPSSLLFVKKLVDIIQPDVLYSSQNRPDIVLGHLISKVTGIPHVIHLHYTVGPWLGEWAFRTIKKSDRLIAVSEYIRETAILTGVSSEKVHTVVNTVDNFPVASKSEASRNTIRAEFGWDKDTQIIIGVGRIDRSKGYRDLILAFERVYEENPKARLLICGIATQDKLYEQEVRELVTDIGLETVITFAGFRRDVAFLLENSDVFCLPSTQEPFGLVFLEAMRAQLPVVAYHSGGVSEIVLHKRTGMLSYPNDIKTLSENLLLLLASPYIAQEMGAAGKIRLESDFSGREVAQRWIEVLYQLVPTARKENSAGSLPTEGELELFRKVKSARSKKAEPI